MVLRSYELNHFINLHDILLTHCSNPINNCSNLDSALNCGGGIPKSSRRKNLKPKNCNLSRLTVQEILES